MIRKALTLWALGASVGAAQTLTCPATDGVTVAAPTAAVAEQTCQNLSETYQDFRACDLGTPPPMHIAVVDTLPGHCLGIFHCDDHQIQLLSPKSLEAKRPELNLFGHLPADRLLASVLHHELAHALYEHSPCPYGSCITTSEYFAYSQQIDAPATAGRAPILAQFDPASTVERDAINVMILFMSPDMFVAKVWGHFAARQDRCLWW